ncbi:MAG: hypothetical protein GY810_26140 [Aureispira sp.]|nr:hypothetical protein [Aureispira sp.]
MYNSKLIGILNILNRNEKELLKKWINSPAHNHRKDRSKLLLKLLNKRKLTPKTSKKEDLFAYVYPVETYNELKLNSLMNLSVQLLEDFIYFSSQKKDTFSKKKALILFFQERKLNKYAQQYIQKAQKDQTNTSIQNSVYYSQQYRLEKIIFEHQNIVIQNQETNLQAVFDNHYLSFILQSLDHACLAVTHQRLYKAVYQIPLLEPILKDIENGKFENIPSIQLYYNAYMALAHPQDKQYFETLKLLLYKHHNILTPKEIKNIYLIAINYCIRLSNSGAEKYVRALLELFQYGLKHSILIDQDVLSRFTYKNIVAAAIRLKEYAWVDLFIKEYTPYLEDEYQENYAKFVYAKLAFAQQEFDKTLELLAQVEFDDVFLNISSKTMLLKIYYEQDYFDALDALLTSFRRYLQRNGVLAYQKELYSNIINLTEKLIKVNPYNKQDKTELQTEIEKTNPLTERPWLLAQLAKLK